MGHSEHDHAVLVGEADLVRATWPFVGAFDDRFAFLHLYNCPCGSTLALPGVGPSVEGAGI